MIAGILPFLIHDRVKLPSFICVISLETSAIQWAVAVLAVPVVGSTPGIKSPLIGFKLESLKFVKVCKLYKSSHAVADEVVTQV